MKFQEQGNEMKCVFFDRKRKETQRYVPVALLKDKYQEKHDGLQAVFHLSQCDSSMFDLQES